MTDPEVEADTVKCAEMVDGLHPISVYWSFAEAEAPVADLAADAADTLEGGDVGAEIELADDIPAALVEGELVGEPPTVQVVTVLYGELLKVTATELTAAPDTERLREIATRIAKKYAENAASARLRPNVSRMRRRPAT